MEGYPFGCPFVWDKHYNLDISNFRFAILTSRPTALLGRTAFTAFERFAAGKSSADCARRRVSERNRREEAALGAEMGGFAALSIKISKGVAAFGRRNPKRKDILSDVLSFWCARRESNPHALASTGT